MKCRNADYKGRCVLCSDEYVGYPSIAEDGYCSAETDEELLQCEDFDREQK